MQNAPIRVKRFLKIGSDLFRKAKYDVVSVASNINMGKKISEVLLEDHSEEVIDTESSEIQDRICS